MIVANLTVLRTVWQWVTMEQMQILSQDEACLTAPARIVPEERAWANHTEGLHLSPWLPGSQLTHRLASQGSVSPSCPALHGTRRPSCFCLAVLNHSSVQWRSRGITDRFSLWVENWPRGCNRDLTTRCLCKKKKKDKKSAARSVHLCGFKTKSTTG